MSSAYVELTTVQEILTRYGMSTYLVLGNAGFVLCIICLSESRHRRNPCSLYLLSATVARFVALNVGVIPIIYSLDHPDPSSTSLIFCKVQYYFRHVSSQMMRSFIILACADRYALCSTRARIRSFNQYYVAIRLIPCVVIGWLALTSFIPVLQSIENGKCDTFNTDYALIYTIYNFIFIGVVPPVAMMILGYMIVVNLKWIRTRFQSNTGRNATQDLIRKRDQYLVRITLVDVTVYLFTTAPYTIVMVYLTATASIDKSIERKRIESFTKYLSQSFLVYLNDVLPFWIYFLVSRPFRQRLKHSMMKFYSVITAQ